MPLASQYEKITSRGVRGLILARLDTGDNSWVNDIAMTMTSDQSIETYAWLGSSPAMREFVGGRTPAELAENSFTITNKDYEGSIKIKLKDLRRDKLGMITARTNQLADRALDHPAALISKLLISGASKACYDSQYFFDTDHSEGKSGIQSNKITSIAAVITMPTVDEFSKAVLAAIQTIFGFKDDRGEPMNQSATEFQLQVPVAMMGVALTAVTALLGTGGMSNILPALAGKFKLNVVPNPRLTWTDTFALLRTDEAAKPFILQQEGEPDVITLDEASEYCRLNKECLFGIDWSGNVGFAYWQHAVQVTFATS
jgi:phage major head subunit gpT-like protein